MSYLYCEITHKGITLIHICVHVKWLHYLLLLQKLFPILSECSTNNKSIFFPAYPVVEKALEVTDPQSHFIIVEVGDRPT